MSASIISNGDGIIRLLRVELKLRRYVLYNNKGLIIDAVVNNSV